MRKAKIETEKITKTGRLKKDRTSINRRKGGLFSSRSDELDKNT